MPEEIRKELNSEITNLYEKYGKKCRDKVYNDEIYYDIPHITLLSMGPAYENIEKIKEKLETIAKDRKTIFVKSKKLIHYNKSRSNPFLNHQTQNQARDCPRICVFLDCFQKFRST